MGGGLVGHWFDSGKERLPKEIVSRVGISAKCHHLHDCMAQVILFTLHFSYRGILVTITRGNNWRVLRRICLLIPEWGTETYRELWDIFFILFLFVFSTFFLFITQPMGLLICWFILTIDNVFTLKTSKKKKSKNANIRALVYIYQLTTDAQKLKQIVVTKVKIQKDFQSSLLQTIIYFHLTFSNKGLNLSANSHSRACTRS